MPVVEQTKLPKGLASSGKSFTTACVLRSCPDFRAIPNGECLSTSNIVTQEKPLHTWIPPHLVVPSKSCLLSHAHFVKTYEFQPPSIHRWSRTSASGGSPTTMTRMVFHPMIYRLSMYKWLRSTRFRSAHFPAPRWGMIISLFINPK